MLCCQIRSFIPISTQPFAAFLFFFPLLTMFLT
jgi:hypothetical protein